MAASALVLLLLARATPAAGHDCFRQHIEEAIALNTERRAVYAAATGGASTETSDRLIAAERLSLLLAAYFDRAARPYQRAGIPLLCAEFVPMSGAAPLTRAAPLTGAASLTGAARLTGAAPLIRVAHASGPEAPIDGHALEARLHRAWTTGGLHRLRWAAEWELRQLEATPDRRCMVRHLIESIRRAAVLAPRHAALARDAGLPSPLPLSRRFIETQLAVLGTAAELDADAAPLQRAGVPILCADLPPIPAGEGDCATPPRPSPACAIAR